MVETKKSGGGNALDSISPTPAAVSSGTASGTLTEQIDLLKGYLVTVISHRDSPWSHRSYDAYKIEGGVLSFVSRAQVGTDGVPSLSITGKQLNCYFRAPGSAIPYFCTLALIEIE